MIFKKGFFLKFTYLFEMLIYLALVISVGSIITNYLIVNESLFTFTTFFTFFIKVILFFRSNLIKQPITGCSTISYEKNKKNCGSSKTLYVALLNGDFLV
jgi:hypothetical protein